MAKVKKATADKARITRTVVSAAEKHGEEIAAGVEPLIFPEGVPAELTLAAVIVALGAGLDGIQKELERRDNLLVAELGEDTAASDAVVEKEAELRGSLVRARSGGEACFGTAALVALGLSEAVPPGIELLLRYADIAGGTIETARVEPIAADMTMDRPAVAANIRTQTAALRAAIDHDVFEERDTQSARSKRDVQAELWQRAYSGFADALAGLASAAGLSDIADRVRPTARRRAGIPEDIDVSDPIDPTEV
jgi:hypothetical protein